MLYQYDYGNEVKELHEMESNSTDIPRLNSNIIYYTFQKKKHLTICMSKDQCFLT